MFELSAGACAGCRSAARAGDRIGNANESFQLYLDVNLLASYWGQDRAYHHTAPISMNYGLHEALASGVGGGA